jgi:hypothetical protein
MKTEIINIDFFFFKNRLHLEPPHQPYFCEGFFEIGICELFAWAGFASNHHPPDLLCTE